jgi:PAS domain S-box-containing protein
MAEIDERYEDYAAYREEKTLKEYVESKAEIAKQFSDLKELILNEGQRKRIEKLEKFYFLKIALLDSGFSKVYKTLREKEKFDIVLPFKDPLQDSINATIDDFNFHENEILTQRSEISSVSSELALTSSIIGASVLFITFSIIYVILMREIQKKKESERELFIQTEWYNKTLLSIGDAVIATDKNGIITFINKAAEDITEWRSSETIGKHVDFIFQIFNEASGLMAENPLKKALSDGKIYLLTNHTQLKTRTGKKVFIEDSAAPVFDDENEIMGGVLIFRDIDEKTHSLKQLAFEKQILSGIIDNTSLIISIRDLDERYTLVNKQFEKIFRMERKDIVGKTMEYIYRAADIDNREEIIRALTASDSKIINEKCFDSFELEVVNHDGVKRCYLVNKFPLLDENSQVSSICMVSNDITESKTNLENQVQLKYYENLSKSEMKFEELIQNMPIMYFTFDENLRITFWNKATEDFTSIKSKDAAGKKIAEIFPNDSIPIEEHCSEVLKTNKPKSFIFNFTIYGKSFTADITLYKSNAGVAGLSFDITEQRYAENATRELIESLQKRNNELKQFAYIVSHNLRAPISKIQGLAALFDTEPEDETLNKTVIANIHAGANDLDTIVKDINTVISSRESEKDEHEFTVFDVELNLVKQILNDEIKKAGSALITTDFRDPAGMLTIKSNIHNALLNLLSNALKYRAPQRNLHVHFQTQQDDHYVKLIVEDNGIGLDLNKYGKKIFGLYKRFHGSTIEGRGLGLYLVKTQIESMNGKIEVESTVDKGTKFIISLPKNNKEVK